MTMFFPKGSIHNISPCVYYCVYFFGCRKTTTVKDYTMLYKTLKNWKL